ncbi:MAG TPA: HAD-IIB family hydrolase [Candidatus Limnocylindrales bacterium]|nr:HAD-IIB family hydrolase [Candidatus Limnocylindrales bacterium]
MLSLSKSSQLLVVTDLDGTLLDEQTYSYELCLPALRRLRAGGIPVVMCSTKTSAEMLPLWRELDLDAPFICESGGAIYFPRGYLRAPLPRLKTEEDFEVLELGGDIIHLRLVLADVARECNVVLQSFGQMSVDEIAELTGLKLEQARCAAQRRYNEPFRVTYGDVDRLIALLHAKKLTVTKGGCLYHLTAGHSKGDAVARVLQLHRQQYGETIAIGLGNSANDWPMLHEVERPVLVKTPDGRWDATVVEHVPNVLCTDGIGPAGWTQAIEKILDEAVP